MYASAMRAFEVFPQSTTKYYDKAVDEGQQLYLLKNNLLIQLNMLMA